MVFLLFARHFQSRRILQSCFVSISRQTEEAQRKYMQTNATPQFFKKESQTDGSKRLHTAIEKAALQSTKNPEYAFCSQQGGVL